MGWSTDKSSWERVFPRWYSIAYIFQVYMNDIRTTVPRHMLNTLHADDFTVWYAEEHITTAVHCIQNTFSEVCSLTESWALQLNTTKTVSTLFTLSTAEEVSLKLNSQPVPQVEMPMFLGVTLDTHLTWKPHLEAVEAKATRKLTIMKKLAGTTWGGGWGGGAVWHPETGLHRGCETSRWVCLHNLGYCLKNQQKQARQSAEHGHEDRLRCYEEHTNPTNGKDGRPSTFGIQIQVQSCHPRGKIEETD